MNQFALIVVFILISLTAAFIWYSSVSTPAGDDLGNELTINMETLNHLEIITLDTSILQDPLFKALHVSQPPPPDQSPVGRTNPFIP